MNQLRRVLITGGNRGLGFKLAEFLSPKYQILLTARNILQAEDAKAAIIRKVPSAQIETELLDIASIQSIKDFSKSLKSKKIDVIVNNAGVNDELKCEKLAYTIMNTNLGGLINLTETVLPNLAPDGKIILISSMLGKLKIQTQAIKKKLNQPLTKQEILKMGRELIEVHQNTGTYGEWSAHIQPLYKASKALTNAYGRYVLSNIVKENQSVYCVHPGWVKTDMGGANAPGSIEDGIVTSSYLIDQVPFGRNAELHGKYFNDKCKIEEY